MEILNYQDGALGTNVIGTFSVYLPAAHMTFHKLKLIRSKKGNSFISFPSFAEENKEDPYGKKSFFPYIEISKERNVEFMKKVAEALEPFVNHADLPKVSDR